VQPSGLEAYKLGRRYEVMPIAMVPDACVAVSAGPVTFVVESRRLTEAAIIESAEQQGRLGAIDAPAGVDDGGMSLHVLGTADGLEHLRFDCFEREPHYHYIHQDDRSNVVVRFDDVAEGDPTRWTLERVRSRLPEMLEHAGATELAVAARAAAPQILEATAEVESLLYQASATTASAVS
jgi:hypothetical protein